MKGITRKAYAKLNLFLNIKNKREDGFHEIETIFERISLFDTVDICTNEEKSIVLTCSNTKLENNENLCYKAAELFLNKTELEEGVTIHLDKNIPIGSGLGGASSDAAAVLLGLNDLLKTDLSKQELYMLGAQIGSDVNFFISEERFAIGVGRGEEITPIKSDKILNHILLLGHEEMLTKTVFKLYKAELTKHSDSARLIIHYLESSEDGFPIDLLYNALTDSYLELSKKSGDVFNELNRADETFLLSGSGSTINIMVPNDEYDLNDSLRHKLKEWGIQSLKVTSQ